MGRKLKVVTGEKSHTVGDLSGLVFGRLTVLGFVKINANGLTFWECKCACGGVTISNRNNLIRGTSKSCGCMVIKNMVAKIIKHGECFNYKKSKEYRAWLSLRERCINSNSKDFYRYGGRGITVCDRWITSFENFLNDMGRAPSPKHSIDRKNNEGNYEPENCRWANAFEQANNTRKNRLIEYKGEIKTISIWCRELGMKYQTVNKRLAKGQPINTAFKTTTICK